MHMLPVPLKANMGTFLFSSGLKQPSSLDYGAINLLQALKLGYSTPCCSHISPHSGPVHCRIKPLVFLFFVVEPLHSLRVSSPTGVKCKASLFTSICLYSACTPFSDSLSSQISFTFPRRTYWTNL